jgi:putative ABC transport system ATP-binding protein
MLKLNNITVTFNRNSANQFNALENLFLEVKEKEFTVIIGGNGAGKSTLMNVIAANIKPDYGNILIEGEDVTAKPPYNRAKYVSRVFQDPRLGTFADLTIAENYVIFSSRNRNKKLSFYNLSIKEFKEQVSELGVGLEDRFNQPIGMLSGGQRQLLALMMSLSAPTKILLLDEHTAALDPKIADLVMQLTNNLIKRFSITALMITHNMRHAVEFGNRVIVMHHGQIAHDINSEEKKLISPSSLWEETQAE